MMIAILVLFSLSSYLKMNEYPHKLPEEKYYYLSNSPNKNQLTTWLDIIYQRSKHTHSKTTYNQPSPPQHTHNMIMWKLFFLVAFACPLFHAHLSFLSSYFLPETRIQSKTEESKNTKKTKTQHVSIFSKNPSNASQNTFTFKKKRFQVYFCSRHDISYHYHNQQTIHNK